MTKKRVVVTGMGIISPVGNDIQTSWSNLLAGKSGISHITHFDTSKLATTFAGQVKNFDPLKWLADAKDQKKVDKDIQYGIAASTQAIEDAGLDDNSRQKAGVAIGSGIGGLSFIENNCLTLFEKGARRVSPFFIPGSIINMVSGYVSMMNGMKGPNIALATACTTGTHSIGLAARMIAYGDAEVMVAGGAESPICPLGVAGFNASRALSTRNDDPTKASRPWDVDRDGFVLSEGAGVLVLEDYEHALKRNARIHAELKGFGMSGDAFHITLPPEDGSGAVACMNRAIEDAELNPEDIGYVNAHGTSTLGGDVAETVAIRRAFGSHVDSLAVSSTKSMTGHLLGAAGAVEAIFAIMAVKTQKLPPTINLDRPGEGCDLDYIPNYARDAVVKNALSNSFGFGGTNGSLIFGLV